MLKIYLLSIVYCFILFNNLPLYTVTWNDQADIYLDYLDLLFKNYATDIL